MSTGWMPPYRTDSVGGLQSPAEIAHLRHQGVDLDRHSNDQDQKTTADRQ